MVREELSAHSAIPAGSPEVKMGQMTRPGKLSGRALRVWLTALVIAAGACLQGQEPAAPAPTLPLAAPLPEDRPLPINLPTALKLANARPLDIALASQRVEVAQAQLDRAAVLWLPSIYTGVE